MANNFDNPDQLRESLLIKEELYPNCPGCKVEQYKDSQRGYPIRDLIRVWIVVLASGKDFSRFRFPIFFLKGFF